MKTYTGWIYGYRTRDTKQWAYVGQTINLKSCHKKHLHRGHGLFEISLRARFGASDALEGPIVLERVTGTGPRDLGFNLDWAETTWIFKCHTLQRIWPDGFNMLMFHRSGKVRLASRRGVRKTHWLIKNDPMFREQRRLSSKKGGERTKKLMVTDPAFLKRQRESGRLGAHIQSHVRRGIVKPSCPLCTIATPQKAVPEIATPQKVA